MQVKHFVRDIHKAVTMRKYEKLSQEVPLPIVAVGLLLGETGLHSLSDVSSA